MSPIAGLLVDRHSRKVMMLLSDLAAGLTPVVLLLLVATDSLNIWCEAAYGFRYILDRPSLLRLQSVFTSCNFLNSLVFTTTAAMILFRTDQNATILVWVSSVGGIGGVIGGLMMSIWGGPKRRANGVLFGWAVMGVCGILPMGLGKTWPIWALGLFIFEFGVPIINGSNQAIWQAKVAPDIQGRVFSIRRLLAWVSLPFAKIIAIPLADDWLEPGMWEGGALVSSFGWLVGIGLGHGSALIFIFAGIAITCVSLGASRVKIIRYVEDILPDHTALK